MGPTFRLPAAALFFLVAVEALAGSDGAVPSGQELEAAGAIIGKIRIHRLNIFDTNDPAEDKAVYRFANRLHVLTRDEVIRRELLFHEGEPYRQALVDESARNLRALNVIYHVQIDATAYHDGVVDLEVLTQDTWTLRPAVRYSRAGGDTITSFSFSEQNLLGRMKTLQFDHRKDVDRSTSRLSYIDPRLFGSRLTLNASYSDNSDGISRSLALARPFYSLDSRWAINASGQHLEQTSRLFQNGDTISEFGQFTETVNFSYAFSPGLQEDRVRRFGFGYSYLRNVFTQEPGDEGFGLIPVPDDQKFRGPTFTLRRIKSRFIEATNYNKFDRVEDYNLGNDLSVLTQLSLRTFGAQRSELILSVNDAFGVPLGEALNIFFTFSLSGRTGEGEVSNVLFSEAAESYWRMTERQTLYCRLAFDAGIHLDEQNQLLLGGDSGLRGYPTRQFAGDRRLLFNLEHRYFSNWEIYKLIRIGFASFVDLGDAWYGDTGQNFAGLHPDFGVGLRFAVSRSSVASVSRLDLAYSVDAAETDSPRFQILFGTALKF
jgi:outer membrane protein assembly factor BamA